MFMLNQKISVRNPMQSDRISHYTISAFEVTGDEGNQAVLAAGLSGGPALISIVFFRFFDFSGLFDFEVQDALVEMRFDRSLIWFERRRWRGGRRRSSKIKLGTRTYRR
jgi:hypothetical protein